MSTRTHFDFSDLINWYRSNCDGDWEHQYGVKLETLDNPGWLLIIDLAGTDLDGKMMTEIREGTASVDSSEEYESPDLTSWLHCRVKDNKYVGAGDPTQLVRLFELFESFRMTSTGQTQSAMIKHSVAP